MRIAAVQHDIVWEDRDANFERLAPQVARAVGAGAELVLLTETFSTGFSMTPGIGEPEGGPSAQFLADQAAEHGVWVAGTCPEIADDAERASCPTTPSCWPAPTARTHRYRKLHPFTHAGEHERFRAGEKPVTVQVGGLRITPFICYDLRFADVFWRAGPDTDVYLVPANWPSPRRHHWQTLLQARAIENQAYVVGCNRVGHGGRRHRARRRQPDRQPDGGAAGDGGRRRDDRAGRRRPRRGGRHPRPVPVPPDRRGPATGAADQEVGSTRPRSRAPLQRSGGSPSAARASPPGAPEAGEVPVPELAPGCASSREPSVVMRRRWRAAPSGPGSRRVPMGPSGGGRRVVRHRPHGDPRTGPLHPGSSVSRVGVRSCRELLLALDRLEQRLEVALAEAQRAVPLDQLEEHGGPVAERLGEDLQQVAVLVAVDEDAALTAAPRSAPGPRRSAPAAPGPRSTSRAWRGTRRPWPAARRRCAGCRWWPARGAGRRGRRRTRGTRRSATSSCPTAGSLSGNFTRWLPLATTLLISAEYSVAMSSPTNSAMLVKPMIRL